MLLPLPWLLLLGSSAEGKAPCSLKALTNLYSLPLQLPIGFSPTVSYSFPGL